MKNSTIIIFLVLAMLKIQAQDYLISFTGSGATTEVGTVKVDNLTSGTSITLNGGDILHLFGSVGIGNLNIDNENLRLYPNPMAEQSILTFVAPENGNTVIGIVDLSGRIVCQISTLVSTGTHSFRVSGISRGIYFVKVTGENYFYSTKLISQSNLRGEAGIEYVSSINSTASNTLKSISATIDMPYTNGDQLVFKGISGIYSTVVPDVPVTSKTITFNFAACTDTDGNNYSTVQIGTLKSGTQTWMAENLIVGVRIDGSQEQTNNSIIEKYCYNNDINNCNIYGGLYQWNEMMQYVNTPGVKGICPTGWHIPTDEEWTTLTTFLGGESVAGGKMKSTGTIEAGTGLWKSPNTGATNSSGFTALPGGNRGSSGGFGLLTLYATLWSSSLSGATYAWYRYLLRYDEYVYRGSSIKANGFSGRCLKDAGSASTTPTVSTTSVSNISATTATSGGNVTSDGGATVTAYGVCWSTNANPTTLDNKTTDGTGTGVFVSAISGLTSNTLYYVRAYATNSVGTAYGNEMSFSTLLNPILSTVTTTAVTNITQTTANSGGNVLSDGGTTILFRGVCWHTSPNPTLANSYTTNGSGTGEFASNLTNLSHNTLYYVRAYAVNSSGTAYGNEITFATLPTVTTNAVTSITQTTAASGGNISAGGGVAVTARGVCWSTSTNPTIADNYTTDGTGTGVFISNLTGLTGNTVYYVRAYATNGSGTSYGNQQTFTTAPVLATITTDPAIYITLTTSTSGGNVTSDGGSTITARGVCWNTTSSPTTANSKTTNGAGTGEFVSTLANLNPNTFYYVRAYATNSAGTAYGNEISFITLLNPVIPTVSTAAITNLTGTTATGGGNVLSDGGSTVIFRGVCWSTSPNPTMSNSYTTDGSGTGVFASSLTGLNPNSNYYVRAYAMNSVGTSYGNELVFTNAMDYSCPGLPTVTYGGQTYNTVQIGTQCWFRENINIGTKIPGTQEQANNNIIEKYCYNDDEANCDIYGGLYQWNEMMQYITTEGVQGICPSGWHLPTDTEWTTLTTFLGGESVAGGKMKEAGLSHWRSPNTGATNSSGFTALPGGFRGYYGYFSNLTNIAGFWSSSQDGAADAWYRYLDYSYEDVYPHSSIKASGFSGRCVQD